jgi:hypothetical protein
MKRVLFIGIVLAFSCINCEKSGDNVNQNYLAEVKSYDLSCSTCILTFPYQSDEVIHKIGESEDNLYRAVNLNINDFSQGEILKVNLREAKDDEIPVCTTMGPTYNYKNIYVEGYNKCSSLTYGEKVTLAFGDCLSDNLRNRYICFDTVVTDSRCPAGGECFWAGEAIVRFLIKDNEGDVTSADIRLGTNDFLIDGYRFSFVDLQPYPSIEDMPKQTMYVATIIVTPN